MQTSRIKSCNGKVHMVIFIPCVTLGWGNILQLSDRSQCATLSFSGDIIDRIGLNSSMAYLPKYLALDDPGL